MAFCSLLKASELPQILLHAFKAGGPKTKPFSRSLKSNLKYGATTFMYSRHVNIIRNLFKNGWGQRIKKGEQRRTQA